MPVYNNPLSGQLVDEDDEGQSTAAVPHKRKGMRVTFLVRPHVSRISPGLQQGLKAGVIFRVGLLATAQCTWGLCGCLLTV